MREGGDLTIKSREANVKVQITLSDTGMGIPEDVIRKLWRPFFTTKVKEIGLGLSISKRIVEARKGNISVERKPGQGSTFSVTLPVGGTPKEVKALE